MLMMVDKMDGKCVYLDDIVELSDQPLSLYMNLLSKDNALLVFPTVSCLFIYCKIHFSII